MGRISFLGEQTSKKYTIREVQDHLVEILDLQQSKPSNINIDHVYLSGTDAIYYSSSDDKVHSTKDVHSDAIGASLGSHGSRHNRGSSDPIDYSLIMKLLIKSSSVSIGLGGSYGTEVEFTPDTNFSRIVPLAVKLDVGGTFATGETITVVVTAYFDDGTTASVSKQYTATGTYYLDEADLETLWKNGVGIEKIGVKATTSNTGSTSVTLSATVRGIQY